MIHIKKKKKKRPNWANICEAAVSGRKQFLLLIMAIWYFYVLEIALKGKYDPEIEV